MQIEIKVPAIGESITEVELGDWKKAKGDAVRKDEPLVVLESEKATVDLPAPEAGVLTTVLKQKGEVAKVGEVLAYLEQGAPAATPPDAKAAPAQPQRTAEGPVPRVMPAAQRVLAEHGLRAEDVQATGPGGRLLKDDVLRHVEQAPPSPPPPPQPDPATAAASQPPPAPQPVLTGDRNDEVVAMSRLRRTVAERLVQAQQGAALLTTFNEIDMSAVSALRKEVGEAFQAKHGVKLGFMSFFVKASVDALKLIPQVNAEIRGRDIVYHKFCDIGVAIGGGKGLVVPVLRNAERMSFAEIELAIGDFAKRARENKLKPDELQGGTFTISNGGVYGSLLSTPIVNPPQSGVLGMHAIQERPVAREGQVVIRPMMYVALTYDHRLIDGREAVTFLKRIKDVLENPVRMLLEI
ncbi:MAG: 2-oxoglutarate dehydrogenase complex dihydrolipoyllysine-residue succinyltransferase [Verrucomicrobiia bacterium]